MAFAGTATVWLLAHRVEDALPILLFVFELLSPDKHRVIAWRASDPDRRLAKWQEKKSPSDRHWSHTREWNDHRVTAELRQPHRLVHFSAERKYLPQFITLGIGKHHLLELTFIQRVPGTVRVDVTSKEAHTSLMAGAETLQLSQTVVALRALHINRLT